MATGDAERLKQNVSEEQRESDSSLDMLSLQFDPLKSLYTRDKNLRLLCPEAKVLDNLAMYENMVRGTAASSSSSKSGHRVDTGSQVLAQRSKDVTLCPEQKNIESTKPKHAAKTVLEFMKEPRYEPFDMLKRCVAHETFVYVWTRHIAGIRGILRGKPILFDGHLNLVMSDVWEVYLPFSLTKRKNKRKRKRKRNKTKKNNEKEEKQLDVEHGIFSGIAINSEHYGCGGKQQQQQQQQQQRQQQHKDYCDSLQLQNISSSSAESGEISDTASEGNCIETGEEMRHEAVHAAKHELGHNIMPASLSTCASVKEDVASKVDYPVECHVLLDLFRSRCTDSKARHLEPKWQFSPMMFVRGDSVVMVTNPHQNT